MPKGETKMANEFKNMTDDQLQAEYKSLYHVVYVEDCFATHDLLYLEAMADELEERGFEICDSVCFVKEDKNEEDEEGEPENNSA